MSGTEPSLEKDPLVNKLNMPFFFTLFPVQHCCSFCLPPRCTSPGALHPPPRPGALPGAFQLDLSTRSWRVERQIHQLPTCFCSPVLLDFRLPVTLGDPSPGCHLSISSGMLSLVLWSSLNSVHASAYHLQLKSLAGPNEFYLNLLPLRPTES